MPVLGGDNRVVAVVVVLHVFANQRGNVRTALGGEGAAGAEIVLHVNIISALDMSVLYK